LAEAAKSLAQRVGELKMREAVSRRQAELERVLAERNGLAEEMERRAVPRPRPSRPRHGLRVVGRGNGECIGCSVADESRTFPRGSVVARLGRCLQHHLNLCVVVTCQRFL
jgi:hypothetical protein